MNTDATCGSTYCLPKHQLSVQQITSIRDDLTVTTRDTFTERETSFMLFGETKTHICIPTFYGIQRFGNPSVDQRTSGSALCCAFNGSLRPLQVKAQEKVLEELESTGGALLCLPCGYGKTVVALNVIVALGRTCIILVGKSFLKDQWIDAIHRFVPDACIGTIQGNKWDTKGANIVIAMIQTLVSRRLSPEIQVLDNFGTCIIDEAHHIAAPTFSRVTTLVKSRYCLGLTATPNRRDGLQRVLLWTCGRIAFQTSREKVQGNVMHIMFKNQGHKERYTRTKKLNVMAMVKDVTQYAPRNACIVRILNHISSHRRILVLSELRGHLEALASAVSIPHGFLVGGMTSKRRDEASKMPLIFATYAYTSEGLDIPQLNTLVLASPRSNITQSVGRILRGASSPLVIDVVDYYSLFIGEWYRRKKTYRSLGLNEVTTTNNSDVINALDSSL